MIRFVLRRLRDCPAGEPPILSFELSRGTTISSSGMPPALFQVGTLDPLLDDTLLMAKRWVEAGNEAELRVYPGGIHTFDMFDIPIAHESRAATVAFIRSKL